MAFFFACFFVSDVCSDIPFPFLFPFMSLFDLVGEGCGGGEQMERDLLCERESCFIYSLWRGWLDVICRGNRRRGEIGEEREGMEMYHRG